MPKTGDLKAIYQQVLDHLQAHGACRIVEVADVIGCHPQTVQAAMCELKRRKLVIKARIRNLHYYGIAKDKYRFRLCIQELSAKPVETDDMTEAIAWAEQMPQIRVVREWQFVRPNAPKWVFDMGQRS